MVTVFELKPNRQLLDPCFETYRLKPRNFRVTETKLQAEVSCPVLEPGQFSLCHVQLQVKRNALISDEFNRELSFYTSHGKVSCVYNMPSSATTSSFQFVSEELAIVLEPEGNLVLLKTGPRETTEKFENICSFETGLRNAVLLNALKVATNGDIMLHFLVCSVSEGEGNIINFFPLEAANDALRISTVCSEKIEFPSYLGKTPGISRLDWIVFEVAPQGIFEDPSWKLGSRHVLQGKVIPRFTKFLCDGYERRSQSYSSTEIRNGEKNAVYKECTLTISRPREGCIRLLICADCRYERNSDVPDERSEGSRISAPTFSYTQDESEVVLVLPLAAGVSKKDVEVIIRTRSLQVIIGAETVIGDSLHEDVDPGCSSWCIGDSTLEITLIKKIRAPWPRLFTRDILGKETLNAAHVTSDHHQLPDLASSAEDTRSASVFADSTGAENCDEPPDEFYLEVFSATASGTCHDSLSNVTGSKYIMDMWSNDGPHLVLRHDVDGLVWRFGAPGEGSIRAEHVHTLSAFGYVVASKRDMVLLTACLEAGFSALVDAKNNVYIYEHQAMGKPKKRVLEEYVLPLRYGAKPVIGGRMFARNLLLLTSDSLFEIALS